MQAVRDVFAEIEGSHPGGVMPRCIVGFTPLFALDCLQLDTVGNQQFSPLIDIDEGDLTFQATLINTKTEANTHRNNEVYS